MKIILISEEHEDAQTSYRRKKESSVSKSKRKSKHKHEYRECLIRTINKSNGKDIETLHLGRICNICGKTHIDKYFITEKTEHGTHLLLNNKDIKEKYRHLEIIDIEE